MKVSWEIDESHEVTAKLHPISGRIVVVSNGTTVFDKINMRLRRAIPFELDDGRKARVEFKIAGTFLPAFRLEVDGVPVPTAGSKGVACPSCGRAVSARDEFCEGCGGKLDPRALFEQAERSNEIKQATSAIRWLVVLFIFSGLLFFALSAEESNDALQVIAEYPGDMVWPEPVNGEMLTVEELRETILWEKWSVLAINFALAAMMAGIAWWAEKAPLPAILTAGAVYLVIQVANAIIDPATLASGFVVKIVIIFVLAKGLKAALASRRRGA